MRDVTKGDLPLLILGVLAEADYHGYAIARKIEERSGKLLKMREGSLYPALRGLEQEGFLIGKWEVQTSGPARKIYAITPEGRAELAARTREWQQYVQMVNGVLGGLNDAQPA